MTVIFRILAMAGKPIALLMALPWQRCVVVGGILATLSLCLSWFLHLLRAILNYLFIVATVTLTTLCSSTLAGHTNLLLFHFIYLCIWLYSLIHPEEEEGPFWFFNFISLLVFPKRERERDFFAVFSLLSWLAVQVDFFYTISMFCILRRSFFAFWHFLIKKRKEN